MLNRLLFSDIKIRFSGRRISESLKNNYSVFKNLICLVEHLRSEICRKVCKSPRALTKFGVYTAENERTLKFSLPAPPGSKKQPRQRPLGSRFEEYLESRDFWARRVNVVLALQRCLSTVDAHRASRLARGLSDGCRLVDLLRLN